MNPPDASNRCPQCGAARYGRARKCWLCGFRDEGEIAATEPRDRQPALNPYAPTAPSGGNVNRTFSLSTMFLWTTLVAVIAGLARIEPGLAIFGAVLSFPAALRTVVYIGQSKRSGEAQFSVAEKIGLFAGALGLVIVFAVGVGTAIFAACTGALVASVNGIPGVLAWAIIVLALAGGGIVAGTVAYFLSRHVGAESARAKLWVAVVVGTLAATVAGVFAYGFVHMSL
jgi:hypothetical protein